MPATSRPGVTVTATSTSRPGSAASIATSQSAVNCLSHRFGTNADSRRCSGSFWSRTSTRYSTPIRSSMS